MDSVCFSVLLVSYRSSFSIVSLSCSTGFILSSVTFQFPESFSVNTNRKSLKERVK